MRSSQVKRVTSVATTFYCHGKEPGKNGTCGTFATSYLVQRGRLNIQMKQNLECM